MHHNEITAEEVMGAALELGIHGDTLEKFLAAFGVAEWTRRENRAYPECYAYAGAYRAAPQYVQRMRREIASVPRVNPDDYDILFNVEGSHPWMDGPSWDVVKWVRVPEYLGYLPGYGYTAVVLLEPFPVYGIPAARGLMSLSSRDFTAMRRNATTMGGGGRGLSKELLRNNLRKQAERQAQRRAEDLEFAEYYRDMFKRSAEELGI